MLNDSWEQVALHPWRNLNHYEELAQEVKVLGSSWLRWVDSKW